MLALPGAVFLLTAAAWAQMGGISTGGGTSRPIGLSGNVALAEGGPLPRKVEIELVCPPNAQIQDRTDAKGAFNVQLGLDRFLGSSDASMSTQASKTGFGGQLSVGRTISQVDGMRIISLMGCYLRAALPGYTSDTYDVSNLRVGDVNTNVGTLFLRRLAGGPGGNTVSVASMTGSGDAGRSLDAARGLIARRQFADAEKELNRVVQAYPDYAAAWQELGEVLQSENRNAEARKAYLEAIARDAKYPAPYLSLARLSATEQNWQDALDKSDALLKLDSTSYPRAYYYNAVAQYNLENYDKAFDSARRAVSLDAAHETPLAEQLLGLLYSMRGDYKAAAEQYRNYLLQVPPQSNVDSIKKRLAEAESHLAAGGPK